MSAPLVRTTVESILVRRVRSAMERAGLETTATDPNPDLLDPMARSLGELGFPVADRATVTDGDLARLPPNLTERFLDTAELHVVRGLVLYFASRPKSQKWLNKYEVDYSSVADQLAAYVKTRTAEVGAVAARSIAVGVGVLPGGMPGDLDRNRGRFGWPW